MILYFTGTGNSQYIAERLAELLGDQLVSINERLKQDDTERIDADGKLIFVVPIYAWRMPRTVEEWIRKVEFSGAGKVWFVMDCAEKMGNAAKYNRKLCEKKQFGYMGTVQIIMPSNYLLMFEVPDMKEAGQIIHGAEPSIVRTAQGIAGNQKFSDPSVSFSDRIRSGMVNFLFYPLCIKADSFHAEDKCIGCGKCEKICPLNNIKMEDKKPVWGKDCTHCMACISFCPVEAIEYGEKSIGKSRYRMADWERENNETVFKNSHPK